MKTDDFFRQFGDVLQNIEFAVSEIYKEHPELTDNNVDRIYENLQRTYQNELKNKAAPKANSSTLEQKVLQNVREMCEWRLGRAEYSQMEKVRGEFHTISWTISSHALNVCADLSNSGLAKTAVYADI